MTESAREQQLSLRVMRLARPKFQEEVNFSVDPGDDFASAIAEVVLEGTGQESVEYPVGTYLMAPQTMNDIYLGESFTFYISVLNESVQLCRDISVKADIQTQTQRISLASQIQESNLRLEPAQQLGQIFTHEIKEIGQHILVNKFLILVCAVNYTNDNEERMCLRKFFKFGVEKPIDVRTKFYNVEDNMNNDVYLEAQIQNLCKCSMVLESVALEVSDLYSSREIQAFSAIDKGRAIFLEPQAVRQYLFRLSPTSSEHFYRGVSSIGKLDMSWRTAMGERGRLQTSPLQRMAPGYGDLRLTVETIPRKVKLLEPFEIVCKLHNCCERSLDLMLSLDETLQPSMVYESLGDQEQQQRQLQMLAPNKFIEFSLKITPKTLGLQYISGIRLTDKLLRRTYEHDDVAQVFVYQ